MESRWRQNVANMGWSSGPYRLLARSLAAPHVALSDRTVSLVFKETLTQTSLDPNNWVDVIFGAALPLTPHFPYGYAVEPDSLP